MGKQQVSVQHGLKNVQCVQMDMTGKRGACLPRSCPSTLCVLCVCTVGPDTYTAQWCQEEGLLILQSALSLVVEFLTRLNLSSEHRRLGTAGSDS